ncbi:MAG TPA: hypothetical protein VN436_18335, partial [Holophaga sp.]|nr:hypothetical protein [Holophaga sp.]
MAGSDPARRETGWTRSSRFWLLVGGGLGLALAIGLSTWRRPGPEPFRQKIDALAGRLVERHWASMHQAVRQIATDEGAKALFTSNPGLSGRIPTEASFLKLARSWRKLVQPLPEAVPRSGDGGLSYVKHGDQIEMKYRIPNG